VTLGRFESFWPEFAYGRKRRGGRKSRLTLAQALDISHHLKATQMAICFCCRF